MYRTFRNRIWDSLAIFLGSKSRSQFCNQCFDARMSHRSLTLTAQAASLYVHNLDRGKAEPEVVTSGATVEHSEPTEAARL